MAAVAFAIVISTFTDAGERARALGVWGFTASGGGSIGVLLGGVLTASFSWHWIFLVNVPIGIAVFVLAPRLLDPDPVAEARPRVDVPGAVTIGRAWRSGSTPSSAPSTAAGATRSRSRCSRWPSRSSSRSS